MTRNQSKSSAKRLGTKKHKITSWVVRASRTQLSIALVFILMFAGSGSWYLYNSYASPVWYCTAHEYYPYEPGTYHGNCVRQIQQTMWLFWYNKLLNIPYVKVDGVYGPQTAGAIVVFQKWWNVQRGNKRIAVDGDVGAQTWGALCPTVNTYFIYQYMPLGCQHHPYGSAPV